MKNTAAARPVRALVVLGRRRPATRQALGKADQEGIRKGRAYPGMTKVGVIYAMGYPPQHATASTDLDEWRYWSKRFNTRIVHFKDGRVTGIQE